MAVQREPLVFVGISDLAGLVRGKGFPLTDLPARLRDGVGAAVPLGVPASFTEAVAVEYKDDGIRCNAILPSVIDTPGNRAGEPDADHSRWVHPEEIARVIRFLCSDDSAAIGFCSRDGVTQTVKLNSSSL